MALPMSYLLSHVGYKKGMAFGLFVMSLGSFLFIPAALGREYLLFLLNFRTYFRQKNSLKRLFF